MTVEELIEVLKRANPKAEVNVSVECKHGWCGTLHNGANTGFVDNGNIVWVLGAYTPFGPFDTK